jgi:hypothetical protein
LLHTWTWVAAKEERGDVKVFRGVAAGGEHAAVAAAATDDTIHVFCTPRPPQPVPRLALYAVRDPALVSLEPTDRGPHLVRMRLRLPVPGDPASGLGESLVEFLLTIGLPPPLEVPFFQQAAAARLTGHLAVLERLLGGRPEASPGRSRPPAALDRH